MDLPVVLPQKECDTLCQWRRHLMRCPCANATGEILPVVPPLALITLLMTFGTY